MNRVGAALAALLIVACARGRERDQLVSKLASGSPRTRAEAVRALSAFGDAQAETALELAAHDTAAPVRLAVAEALGARETDTPVETLGAMLSDMDESVRVAAAAALAHHPSVAAREHLLRAFGRSGARTRLALMNTLVACGASLADALKAEGEARRKWADRTVDHGAAAEREGAVLALGQLGGERALARLSALTMGSGPLALAAVRGLGESGEPAAATMLVHLLGVRDALVRAAAAQALSTLGGAPSASAALSEMATGAGEEAAAAVRALAASAEGKRALEAIAARIVSSEAAKEVVDASAVVDAQALAARLHEKNAAFEAALVLAASARPAAVLAQPLVALLSDADARAAAGAARALSALGIESSAASILNRLETETNARSKALAKISTPDSASSSAPPAEVEQWASLGAMLDERGSRADAGTPESVGAKDVRGKQRLAALLSNGGAPDAESRPGQRVLIEALARAAAALRAPGVVPALSALMHDRNPTLRAAAAWGLARSSEAAARAQAEVALADLPEVRVEALAVALSLPRAKALEVAARAARSDEPRLREEAAVVLGQLGGAEVAPVLTELLEEGQSAAPLAAAALANAKLEAALPALIDAIFAQRAAVAVAATQALAVFPSERARVALNDALIHDQPAVRIAACEVVVTLHLKSALPALHALAQFDPIARVRSAALRAATALE